MPEAYKEIWERDLTEAELDEIALTIDRPDVEYKHRRAFGPRQVEWLIDALDSAKVRLDKEQLGPLAMYAFETVCLELGDRIDNENRLHTKGKLSRLNLFERLQAYQDGERKEIEKSKAAWLKRDRKMEREQNKRMRRAK